MTTPHPDIERLAKVIYYSVEVGYGFDGNNLIPRKWEDDQEWVRDKYRTQARAAYAFVLDALQGRIYAGLAVYTTPTGFLNAARREVLGGEG